MDIDQQDSYVGGFNTCRSLLQSKSLFGCIVASASRGGYSHLTFGDQDPSASSVLK